jgi:hypothetical protein
MSAEEYSFIDVHKNTYVCVLLVSSVAIVYTDFLSWWLADLQDGKSPQPGSGARAEFSKPPSSFTSSFSDAFGSWGVGKAVRRLLASVRVRQQRNET